MTADPRFDVTLIGEYNTSQVCSLCHGDLPDAQPVAHATAQLMTVDTTTTGATSAQHSPTPAQPTPAHPAGAQAAATMPKKVEAACATYVKEERFCGGERVSQKCVSPENMGTLTETQWQLPGNDAEGARSEAEIVGPAAEDTGTPGDEYKVVSYKTIIKHRLSEARQGKPKPPLSLFKSTGPSRTVEPNTDSKGRKVCEFLDDRGELICRRTLFRKTKLHGCRCCRRCSENSGRDKYWDRDLNGARNILYVYECLAKTGERPRSLRPPPRSLTRRGAREAAAES